MIEHLMSSSLSRDHQGRAAGFIRLHVRVLRSHPFLIVRELIARVLACAIRATYTDVFRSIRREWPILNVAPFATFRVGILTLLESASHRGRGWVRAAPLKPTPGLIGPPV